MDVALWLASNPQGPSAQPIFENTDAHSYTLPFYVHTWDQTQVLRLAWQALY